MDRRNFISRSATWLTGGVVASLGSSPLGAGGSRTAFDLGFQSYSLRHFRSTEEFLREARKLDVSCVEIYRGHLDPSSELSAVSAFRRKVEGAGLRIVAFGVEDFTSDHSANLSLFRLGKALGVKNLSANPSPDAFDSLQRLVAEFDIRIAIHNHGPEDERWRRPEWILEAVRELDPRIGACVDTGHYLRAGVDPVKAIKMLGKRVLGVHLKDYDRQFVEQIVGHGELDLEGTLQSLDDVGFEGPLSLEYESDAENPVPALQTAFSEVKAMLERTGLA